MSNPTLKKTKVTIAYASNDGYKSSFDSKGGTGSMSPATLQEVSPEVALLDAIYELARITALFGFHKEALSAFTDAQEKIAKFHAQRAAA